MINLMRVAPELAVTDLPAAVAHYEQQLGFEVVMTMPDGDYAIIERDGVALHLFESQSAAPGPGAIHIFTRGLDELADELHRRGARIIQPIVRQSWGNREFRVIDPSGNVLKFTEPHAIRREMP
jgi:uncharacterized glyoxalase superfamily protein PhnB